jgi:hypothetical protein
LATPEQIRRRGRWSLILGTLLAALLVATVASAADDGSVDGDVGQPGNQNTVALSASAGGAVNTSAGLVIARAGNQAHLAVGDVVVLEYDASTSNLPAGATVSDVSLTIPSPWSTNEQTVTGSSNISFTAPAASTTYTVRWKVKSGPACVNATGNADCFNMSGSFTINLTITASNQSPTVDAGGPYSGDEGSDIALNGATASDGDGPGPLSHLWTIDSSSVGTGSCSLANATSLTLATIKCTDNGTATVKLTATEAGPGKSTSDTANVTIDNVAPTGTFTTPTGNVNEGSSFNLAISGVTDPSAADTTSGFLYAFNCGSGYSGFGPSASASCPTTDDATLSVGGKVKDKDGGVSTYSGMVTVVNVAPSITSASFGSGNASCGTDNVTLTVIFTDPGTADTHVAEVDWDNDGTYEQTVDPFTSGSGISHTYASAGPHTAKVRITDDDDGVSTVASATVVVNYNTSGILQPVNDTRNGQPMSVFKYKSTIPVKIKITDCDGSIVDTLSPTVSIAILTGNPPSEGADEAASTVPPTSGNVMRFTGDPDNQYIYNLATKQLSDPSATYRITVTIQPGQKVTADIGLKP